MKRDTRARRGDTRGEEPIPPPQMHTPLPRTGPQRSATRPATEPYGPAREGVCPGACATARPGKECAPHACQAGDTRSTTHQIAPRQEARHHHGKHPRLTTSEPPRTSASPAVPTAQQPPSGRTCVRPAANPAPASYETAAVWMDVCAPGSEPNPCRLRNSRRPNGRVCARQRTQPLPVTEQPPFRWTCVHPAVNPAPAGYGTAAIRMDV